jgi:hypothetical protein
MAMREEGLALHLADESLIGLNVAAFAAHWIAVLPHGFADAVVHEPSRLVRDAELNGAAGEPRRLCRVTRPFVRCGCKVVAARSTAGMSGHTVAVKPINGQTAPAS